MAGLACLLLNPRKAGQYPYRKNNGLIFPAVVFYGTGFYLFFRSIGLRKKASKAYFEHHKIAYYFFLVTPSTSTAPHFLYDGYAETYLPAVLLLLHIFHPANLNLLPA